MHSVWMLGQIEGNSIREDVRAAEYLERPLGCRQSAFTGAAKSEE